MPNRIAARTYGTVSANRQKEMSGLEFVQGLENGTLPLNTIAQTLGYDIIEAENGRVVVTAVPRETHLNPADTVHGGLAATMLDSCMGLAVQSTLDKGVGSTTLSLKFHSSGRSRRRQARSRRKVWCSAGAAGSVLRRGGSQTARGACLSTAPPPA